MDPADSGTAEKSLKRDQSSMSGDSHYRDLITENKKLKQDLGSVAAEVRRRTNVVNANQVLEEAQRLISGESQSTPVENQQQALTPEEVAALERVHKLECEKEMIIREIERLQKIIQAGGHEEQ